VRDGLTAILSTQPDFQVVGGASDGMEVVQQTTRLRPDVLLLDLEMPHVDGVEALKRLREMGVDVRTIIFTAFDTDERILSAVRAGAQGYLLKGAPREELFNAIRVVHSGGSLLQPIVTNKLLRQISQDNHPDALSPREREVLQLMARGLQNKEIAAELFISERTAKFHVSAILSKLGAGNRTEAVTIALQQGLVEQ
jgi:DNA-binding NarL/FixJ family response regulator